MTNQNRNTQVQQRGQAQPQEYDDKGFTRAVQSTLKAILEKKQKALPKSLNTERFEMNCVQMLTDAMKDYKTRQRWLQCKPATVAMTMAKAAFLDLDFFNGECYAIPYGTDVQFQTDYKGEIKLIKKYSRNPIRDVYAKLVREGDTFEVSIIDGVQHLAYKPDPFSQKNIKGAFAVIFYKDGSMIYDTMGVEEIEKIRNTYSKAKDSQAWRNSYGEMCKKTVLRRICKLVDLDFNADQINAFRDGGDAVFEHDAPPVVETKAVDIFAGDQAMQDKISKTEAAPKQIENMSQQQAPQMSQREKEPEPVEVVQEQGAGDYAQYEEYEQQEFDQFMNQNQDEVPFR